MSDDLVERLARLSGTQHGNVELTLQVCRPLSLPVGVEPCGGCPIVGGKLPELVASALALPEARRGAFACRWWCHTEVPFGRGERRRRRGVTDEEVGKLIEASPARWARCGHLRLRRLDCHLAAHKTRRDFEEHCGRTVVEMVPEMRDMLAARAPAPAAHEQLQAVAP